MIMIKETSFDITCFDKGRILCVYPRTGLNHYFIPVFDYYLDICDQKQRSIKNSMVLEIGILPAKLVEFRSKCFEIYMDKQLVKIKLLSR
jgi:hypothetical protein